HLRTFARYVPQARHCSTRKGPQSGARHPLCPHRVASGTRYHRSSKIVGPSLLSSLRPVLCAPKSGLPSRTFCVFVHCQCAIRDLEFAMSFATNPDTIEQADIDCLGL